MKLEIADDIKGVSLTEETPTSASRLFIFTEDDEIEFILTRKEIHMFKEALK